MTEWYHGLLGVEETATKKEIKKAFALKLKGIDQEQEKEAFQRLNQAYELAIQALLEERPSAADVEVKSPEDEPHGPWEADDLVDALYDFVSKGKEDQAQQLMDEHLAEVDKEAFIFLLSAVLLENEFDRYPFFLSEICLEHGKCLEAFDLMELQKRNEAEHLLLEIQRAITEKPSSKNPRAMALYYLFARDETMTYRDLGSLEAKNIAKHLAAEISKDFSGIFEPFIRENKAWNFVVEKCNTPQTPFGFGLKYWIRALIWGPIIGGWYGSWSLISMVLGFVIMILCFGFAGMYLRSTARKNMINSENEIYILKNDPMLIAPRVFLNPKKKGS